MLVCHCEWVTTMAFFVYVKTAPWCLSFRMSKVGWWDGSATEVLSLQAWGCEFKPQNPCERNPGVVVCACNSSAREAHWRITGACWPANLAYLVSAVLGRKPDTANKQINKQEQKEARYEEWYWKLTSGEASPSLSSGYSRSISSSVGSWLTHISTWLKASEDVLVV